MTMGEFGSTLLIILSDSTKGKDDVESMGTHLYGCGGSVSL